MYIYNCYLKSMFLHVFLISKYYFFIFLIFFFEKILTFIKIWYKIKKRIKSKRKHNFHHIPYQSTDKVSYIFPLLFVDRKAMKYDILYNSSVKKFTGY